MISHCGCPGTHTRPRSRGRPGFTLAPCGCRYSKIVLLDADVLPLHNLDALFQCSTCPEDGATKHTFESHHTPLPRCPVLCHAKLERDYGPLQLWRHGAATLSSYAAGHVECNRTPRVIQQWRPRCDIREQQGVAAVAPSFLTHWKRARLLELVLCLALRRDKKQACAICRPC